jgi:hypothetical protein
MWWEGDIPTPSSGGNESKSAPFWLLIVVILFCVGLGVGLMLIGQDLFGEKPPTNPTPSENAP